MGCEYNLFRLALIEFPVVAKIAVAGIIITLAAWLAFTIYDRGW